MANMMKAIDRLVEVAKKDPQRAPEIIEMIKGLTFKVDAISGSLLFLVDDLS